MRDPSSQQLIKWYVPNIYYAPLCYVPNNNILYDITQLLLPRAVEMHLRVEWKILQFHWNNSIDLQRFVDGVIERLPSSDDGVESVHAHSHRAKMTTRNCEMLVFCNTKYLAFILEAVLTYSISVNRKKIHEARSNKTRDETKPSHDFVTFQAAKIKADLKEMDKPMEHISNVQNNTVLDQNQYVAIDLAAGLMTDIFVLNALLCRMATHFLNFCITFGTKGNMKASHIRADASLEVCPILFEDEVFPNDFKH